MIKDDRRVGLITREKIVEEFKEKAKDIQGCLFVGFSKVGAFAVNSLRNDLKNAGARIFVTKNSLFKKAIKDLDWQDVDEFFDSETGAVFIYDEDIVKSCKALVDFTKENESLSLKGGLIKDKKITAKEIDFLAKLPSRDILLGQAVSAIASPLTGFLSSLNQIILKFVWVVEEIKKTKDKK